MSMSISGLISTPGHPFDNQDIGYHYKPPYKISLNKVIMDNFYICCYLPKMVRDKKLEDKIFFHRYLIW
jgi:hypothetical protein